MLDRIIAAGCLAALFIAAGNGCCCRGPLRGGVYGYQAAAGPCNVCGGGGCHECAAPCFAPRRIRWFGSGCGEVYWDEWHSDPPNCDPCDECGNWIGQQSPGWRHCGWRRIFGFGNRFCDWEPGCACGHCNAGHYGDVTYDGQIIDGRPYVPSSPVPASPFIEEPRSAPPRPEANPAEPRSALKKSAARTMPYRSHYAGRTSPLGGQVR